MFKKVIIYLLVFVSLVFNVTLISYIVNNGHVDDKKEINTIIAEVEDYNSNVETIITSMNKKGTSDFNID